MSRRGRAAVAAVLLVAGVLLIWVGTRPPSPEDRAAAADGLAAGIASHVSVEGASLHATRAIADFGVGADVRLVLVRIVSDLHVEIRLESSTAMSFGGPVRACLVGPDAAPDDAGLEDRCWGDTELGRLIEAGLPRDAGGRPHLPADTPLLFQAALRRGAATCDYPPGAWHLELVVDPLIDDVAAGPRYAPDATFEVPYTPDTPLRLVQERRYCGLASRIYREQGEPTLADG